MPKYAVKCDNTFRKDIYDNICMLHILLSCSKSISQMFYMHEKCSVSQKNEVLDLITFLDESHVCIVLDYFFHYRILLS